MKTVTPNVLWTVGVFFLGAALGRALLRGYPIVSMLIIIGIILIVSTSQKPLVSKRKNQKERNMGMFDTVIHEDDLPDEIPYNIPLERRDFQTKSMESMMGTYVLRDGRLLLRSAIMEDTNKVDEFMTKMMGKEDEPIYERRLVDYEYEDTDYHGDIELHTFFDLDDEQVRVWLQLEARFTEGEHQWTRLVADDEDFDRPGTREDAWNERVIELKSVEKDLHDSLEPEEIPEKLPPITRK